MGHQLDREAAISRVGGDEELLQEIARLFLDDAPSLLSAIETAASAGDAKGLERAAHTLKGSVSNFGAAETYAAALELEKQGRAADFAGIPERIARLRRALDELRPELEALAG
jgi:HPt (histidine-containing phosphotransfer) domain-containing protein